MLVKLNNAVRFAEPTSGVHFYPRQIRAHYLGLGSLELREKI